MKTEKAKEQHRRISVCGMLKYLDVSPYIWTDGGFVYLTSVMDLYARRIIAWTLSRD